MCFDLTSLTVAQRSMIGFQALNQMVQYHDNLRATRRNNDAVAAAKEAELDQIADQEQQQLSERARESLKERARIQAATAEAGVAGALVDRLLVVEGFSAERDRDNIKTNAANARDVANARATSQLVGRPTWVSPVLKIGSTAAALASGNPATINVGDD